MATKHTNLSRMAMAKQYGSSKEIFFQGYIKKEGDHWVAVCIDLNIVGQGATAQEAIDECDELTIEYLEYVCCTYPKELDKYIPRRASKELIEEFYSVIRGRIRSTKPPKDIRPHSFSIETSDLHIAQSDSVDC